MQRENKSVISLYCSKCERTNSYEYLRTQKGFFDTYFVYSCLSCATPTHIEISELEKTIKETSFRE